MSRPGPLARVRQHITEIVGIACAVLMIVGLFTSPWLFVAGIVGTLFLPPLLALLFGDRDAVEEWWGEEKADQLDGDTAQESDPLATVKRRYAQGDLSEAEFEYKVQRLLDVDNPDVAGVDDATTPTDDRPDSAEFASERDRSTR